MTHERWAQLWACLVGLGIGLLLCGTGHAELVIAPYDDRLAFLDTSPLYASPPQPTYLLVLMHTGRHRGESWLLESRIVAEYADPYECEQLKTVLTGSTPAHRYVVCVPAEETR